MKGREVFESNVSLLLNEQKLIKGKDYAKIAVSHIQNGPSHILRVTVLVAFPKSSGLIAFRPEAGKAIKQK